MDVRFPPLTAIVSVCFCFCFWAMRPMSGFGVDPNFGFRPIADLGHSAELDPTHSHSAPKPWRTR